ncbi:MAG: hypothetical protein HYX67_00055 [Candidatus Melainabacteria bacterium]|nr:hypothetical protein [Candidatus Melainabacteria bacterium]
MKFKTLSAIAAVTLLIGGLQSAEAKNPGKGGVGPGPAPASQRNFGYLSTTCSQPGDQASASFQNVPGIGQTVQLQATNFGIASTSVESLKNSLVTMLGSIQFYSDVPANNLQVHINFTIPGGTVVPFDYNLAQGSLQKAAAPNLYFIGTNNANGNIQLQPGSRINEVTFNLIGTGGSQITERIYGLSFTGFGGVGYDLTTPASFCSNNVQN